MCAMYLFERDALDVGLWFLSDTENQPAVIVSELWLCETNENATFPNAAAY